jgi:hypothetical protein
VVCQECDRARQFREERLLHFLGTEVVVFACSEHYNYILRLVQGAQRDIPFTTVTARQGGTVLTPLPPGAGVEYLSGGPPKPVAAPPAPVGVLAVEVGPAPEVISGPVGAPSEPAKAPVVSDEMLERVERERVAVSLRDGGAPKVIKTSDLQPGPDVAAALKAEAKRAKK